MRETLIILGTFLPAIGLAATALVATATRGARRWTVLIGLPALTSVACSMIIDPVWSNGNLLAAAVYMSFFVTMLIYYPVLAVVGVVLYLKANRRQKTESGATAAVVILIVLVPYGIAVGAQDDLALPAPLQVEAVIRELAERITSDRTGEPRVVVNLGAAEGKTWPTWEAHASITLLGTAGSMPAQLVEIIKVCEALCGEEFEECHYEARYVPSGSLDMVGTPVAALPGSFALSHYVAIPAGGPRAEISEDGLAEDFVEAIWPEENPADTRHRFRRSEDSFVLEYAWGDRGEQIVPANGCGFFPRGLFVRMACNGIEALIADRVPILVSFPDYNSPDVDVIASFTHAAQPYYIARFALKAQTVHGLLYQAADGWRARFQPRDYALLC